MPNLGHVIPMQDQTLDVREILRVNLERISEIWS